MGTPTIILEEEVCSKTMWLLCRHWLWTLPVCTTSMPRQKRTSRCWDQSVCSLLLKWEPGGSWKLYSYVLRGNVSPPMGRRFQASRDSWAVSQRERQTWTAVPSRDELPKAGSSWESSQQKEEPACNTPWIKQKQSLCKSESWALFIHERQRIGLW